MGTSGCGQAEDAKKAASELVTQSVEAAKNTIGIESGNSKEFESQNEDDDESGETKNSKEN